MLSSVNTFSFPGGFPECKDSIVFSKTSPGRLPVKLIFVINP